ncbi:hypothetical protein MTR67_052110 [Solanum verrucosum]|uniref:Integrase zinc-binding domain-containing protein n=1 Tax=Solanum verrucosum TaxID=315347 RepID=A0AAF0V6D3_SOLVR|nr:hypothetical protein MTR67_052110 [Solanum verrucosum]
MSVLYHLGKTNVVVDALSRLSIGSVAHIEDDKEELVRDVHRLAWSHQDYRDLREIYWWNGMKKDIAEFVAKCPNLY